MNLHSQYMLGSNLMASPVIKSGERQKRTYFPEEIFFDFFEGNVVNTKEEWKNIDAPLDKIPIFLRAGFIVLYQTPSKEVSNLNEMRKLPLEVVIGLDINFRANGKIYLDDGISKTLYELKLEIILKIQIIIDWI